MFGDGDVFSGKVRNNMESGNQMMQNGSIEFGDDICATKIMRDDYERGLDIVVVFFC